MKIPWTGSDALEVYGTKKGSGECLLVEQIGPQLNIWKALSALVKNY